MVYATDPDNVFYLTERPVRQVPLGRNITTHLPNQTLEVELLAMAAELKESRGVIVFFTAWNPNLVKEAFLVERLGLIRLATYRDGVLYCLRDAPDEELPTSALQE